jgi:iron(III) transport system substrate-binding protein
MAPAVPPHREWVGFCLNVLVAAYNTNLVKKADLPATYDDLVDAKWKDRLGIEVDDFDWFAGLIEELGEAKGVDLFRDIAATNGFSVRKGHTLLANLVAAGEVPLALTVFNYTAEQLRRRGAPIAWFPLAPLISMPNSVSVANAAPHPHAAVLFLDFMLSDAQEILAGRDYVVTSAKVASPLDRGGLKVLDSARILADSDKWRRVYADVVSSRK